MRDSVRAEDLTPGDVIVFPQTPSLALVVSQDIPAKTLVREEAEKYCEPGLQIIKHSREDFWVVTHDFTYALFTLGHRVERNNSVRVQLPNHGEYRDEVDRKKYFRQPEHNGETKCATTK